eukprot:Rhum_TRINITY_DN9782_c0_g1::Rhum_TRINITY_DN9782_c0_g1_i1::g.35190::m.35190
MVDISFLTEEGRRDAFGCDGDTRTVFERCCAGVRSSCAERAAFRLSKSTRIGRRLMSSVPLWCTARATLCVSRYVMRAVPLKPPSSLQFIVTDATSPKREKTFVTSASPSPVSGMFPANTTFLSPTRRCELSFISSCVFFGSMRIARPNTFTRPSSTTFCAAFSCFCLQKTTTAHPFSTWNSSTSTFTLENRSPYFANARRSSASRRSGPPVSFDMSRGRLPTKYCRHFCAAAGAAASLASSSFSSVAAAAGAVVVATGAATVFAFTFPPSYSLPSKRATNASATPPSPAADAASTAFGSPTRTEPRNLPRLFVSGRTSAPAAAASPSCSARNTRASFTAAAAAAGVFTRCRSHTAVSAAGSASAPSLPAPAPPAGAVAVAGASPDTAAAAAAAAACFAFFASLFCFFFPPGAAAAAGAAAASPFLAFSSLLVLRRLAGGGADAAVDDGLFVGPRLRTLPPPPPPSCFRTDTRWVRARILEPPIVCVGKGDGERVDCFSRLLAL